MRRAVLFSTILSMVLAVVVVASAWSPAVSSVDVEAASAEKGWITGRVVGPDHKPTVGLTVDTWEVDVLESLDSGEFSLELEPGRYRVIVQDTSPTRRYLGLQWRNASWPSNGCSADSSAERMFDVVAGETIDAGEWVLQILPDPAPVPPVPTGPRPDDWLGALNWYRAWSRLPPVEADPCGNANQLKHIEYLLNSAEYMTGDYFSAHRENPESPWWTPEGVNAGSSSNIGWYDGSRAIELWMQAPYHAMNLLAPSATVVSFASSGGRSMLDSDRERLSTDSPIVIPSPTLFPGDGSTVPLNKHTGEIPSPIDSCPGWEAGPYRGLPLFVRDLENYAAAGTKATLRFPDGEVVVGPSDRLCVITNHSGGSGAGNPDRVIVIYEEPLPDGTYTASITDTGSPDVTWTFTIDAQFDPPTDPGSGSFVDDDGSVFEADIEWMAAAGITKGCNPPTNDRFCPEGKVTRGQMAAFLVRALSLTDRLDNPFRDDDTSIFQADIERMAAAGITKGCNPPTNDRFCPEGKVTRGQMAAFLVRALGYTNNGGGDLFTDDDASIFEADIDRLGTAGVTKGCNPPTNDRYCPTGYVTRGQMAAFLHRALG